MTRFRHYLKNPVALMIVSVALWAFYPPLVNDVVDELNIFLIAAIAHGVAALGTVVFVYFRTIRRFPDLVTLLRSRKSGAPIRKPVLYSAIFVFLNHILLYAALSMSREFDTVAILVFEIWPILFFLHSGIKDRRKLVIGDYVFSIAAFVGLIVLAAPNLHAEDWILFDGTMFMTMGLALSGGFAMAATVFWRYKCMDAWQTISDDNSLDMTKLDLGLLTEAMVRTLSAAVFILALPILEPAIPALQPFLPVGDLDFQALTLANVALLAFIGLFIIAFSSVLYDMSIYASEDKSVSILWYLMPVGSLAVLAFKQDRLLNEYEAVASVLIVSSNILLSRLFPVRNSLTVLFAFVSAYGLCVMFVPNIEIDNYYQVLSVSIVFFALLSAFSLDRASQQSQEREKLIGAFREKLMRIYEPIDAKSADPAEQGLLQDLKSYAVMNVHVFLRAFRDHDDFDRVLEEAEKKKTDIVAMLRQRTDRLSDALALFRQGDRIGSMESSRITSSEYVILFLLGGANILFALFFRPPTFSASVFSLVLAIAAMYLLLVIYERDRYSRVGEADARICNAILRRLGVSPAPDELVSNLENRTVARLKQDTERSGVRMSMIWAFLMFSFLIGGFGYGFLYRSVDRTLSPEPSPMSVAEARSDRIGIGVLNWPSAHLKAEILKVIITRYTHLDAELVPASNTDIFQRMHRSDGNIDIHPEFWMENNEQLVRRYVSALGTIRLGRARTVGRQGLCLARGAADGGMNAIGSLKEIDTAKFDFMGDGRGDIWIGAVDWASTAIERRRLTSYGLDRNFEFHVLDDKLIRKIYAQRLAENKSTVFFCYSPDSIFIDERVSMLSEPAHSTDRWVRLTAEDGGDPVAGGASWPPISIHVAFAGRLARAGREIPALLDNFHLKNRELERLLHEVEQGTSPEAVARRWVLGNEARILGWLIGNPQTPGG